MAVQGTDGKRYHSASRAHAHGALKPSAAPPKAMNKPAAASSAPAGGSSEGQDLSHMDMKEVVAKHGPAHKVEMEHDHAGGKHRVKSHHKGGHHTSEHGSADEAHMHAAKAAGVETPDEANADEDMAYAGNESPEEENAEASIPGM